MVKGISKRVIVVKAPISSMFDQAIFILNENSFSSSSVDAKGILEEACAVADDYVRANCNTKKKRPNKGTVIAFLSSGITLLLCGLFYTVFL